MTSIYFLHKKKKVFYNIYNTIDTEWINFSPSSGYLLLLNGWIYECVPTATGNQIASGCFMTVIIIIIIIITPIQSV